MHKAYDTEIKSVYIHLDNPKHFNEFTDTLNDYFTRLLPQHEHKLVIVCIGTDRATGDSLGPLIGYKLSDMQFKNVTVFGTLDNPVHAKNLDETTISIKKEHPNSLILAIDASLGSLQNVGSLCIGPGGIKPGAGVKKDLPPIGDFYITGIVNFSSLMNMVVLQNTRLSTVMRMADVTSSSLRYSLWKYYSANSRI
ncbi:MAG: spore protease YyaC [Cellulosilyticaceae bacterium]